MTDDKTHWQQNPNKNYLGHWDLPDGNDLVLTIKKALWEEVENPQTKKKENLRVVHFEEDYKPLICNETNAKSILKATGHKFMEESCGGKILLFVDRVVNPFEKEEVDCVRVRPTPPRGKEVLDESHPKWEAAKKNVAEGKNDLEGLRKHWTVSAADWLKLKA